MKNIKFTVTHNKNDSLEYQTPNVKYAVGERFDIHEQMKLWINGNLSETFVEFIEVKSIDIEYIVDEKEYYIQYEVGYNAYNDEFYSEKLDQTDLDTL